MADGHIKIDTRLDNSKIKNDLNELKNMVENGAEEATEEFAQKVEKLNAAWAKLEAQQSRNNSKISEYKAEMADLQRYMNLDTSAGKPVEIGQLKAYEELAQKLKEAEANAQGLEASMSKVGLDAQKLSQSTKQVEVNTKTAKTNTEGMSDGVKRGTRTLARYAGMLLGVRAIYGGIQKAVSAWMSSTQEGAQAQADLAGIWASLGNTLAPVIQWLINGLKTILGYVNAITKGLFGFELFSRGTAKNLSGAVKQAKELRKQLAGFDEANVLGDNGQQNLSGGSGASVSGLDIEAPDLEWLQKYKPLVDALIDAFKILFDSVVSVTLWIGEHFVKGLMVVAEWLGKSDISVKDLVITLGGLLIAFQLFKVLSAASPFAWVVIAIVAIITAIGWLSENWESVVDVFNNTIGKVIDWFQNLGSTVSSFFDNLIKKLLESDFWFDRVVGNIISFFRTAINLIASYWKGFFSGIFEEASNVIKNIKGIFSGLITFLSGVFSGDWKKAWQGIVKVFENVIGGIANVFKAPFNIIISGINGFIRAVNKIKVPDWVPSWLGGGRGFNIPQIPRLAKGGITTGATTAIIGEAGREAVVPLQNNTGWAKDFLDVLSQYGGFGGNSNQPQVIQLVVDRKVLAQVVNDSNKNDNFATNGGLSYGY
ncbi:hypothetical protein G7059_01830 [Erysipelothrix sp. HDW6A]|uniref:phage tail protein n=1 Tax=Erysipelothrix sp. HDW6A TaxID=2714928 RepID=UPI00140C1125|nr:hypothetical protein [Erysipelothrix sp. HDW6A]QIK56673.1 hypothetical protein G7059_01830 [Erysipelothrix sp. HDW6A]